MNNIQDFLDKVTQGVEITPEERKIIYGIYMINYFKASLEALISLNSNNPEFQIELIKYLNSEMNLLNPEAREEYDQMMENEKGRILGDIIKLYKEKLSPADKDRLEQNLAELFPKDNNEAAAPAPIADSTPPVVPPAPPAV